MSNTETPSVNIKLEDCIIPMYDDILDDVYSKLEYLCSNSEFGIEPPCKEVCTLDKNDEYFSNRCAKARLEWLLDK